jgi:hypothetical protein
MWSESNVSLGIYPINSCEIFDTCQNHRQFYKSFVFQGINLPSLFQSDWRNTIDGNSIDWNRVAKQKVRFYHTCLFVRITDFRNPIPGTLAIRQNP